MKKVFLFFASCLTSVAVSAQSGLLINSTHGPVINNNQKKVRTTTNGFVDPTGSNDYNINQTGFMRTDGVLDNSTAGANYNSNSSSNNRSNTQSSRNCRACNGTGMIERNSTVSGYGIRTDKHKCATCGKWIMAGTAHSHTTCPSCHGRGRR